MIAPPSKQESSKGLFDIQNSISLQGKVWADFNAALYKGLGFPTCAASTSVFLVIPGRFGMDKENWHEHEAHAACCIVSNKGLCLYPRSLMSSANIHEIMAGQFFSLQVGKISGPTHI